MLTFIVKFVQVTDILLLFYLFCPILFVFQPASSVGISPSQQSLDDVKTEHLLHTLWVLWMPWHAGIISEANCGEGFSHFFSSVSKRRRKNAEPGF